jgi:predicted transcriptional regulator
MKTTTLTVRIDERVARRLKKLATAVDRSSSYLAAEAIEEYLTLQEWQVEAIRQGLGEAERGAGRSLQEVRRLWEARRADPAD